MQKLLLPFYRKLKSLCHVLPFNKSLNLLLKLQKRVSFVQKRGCIILALHRFMLRTKVWLEDAVPG